MSPITLLVPAAVQPSERVVAAWLDVARETTGLDLAVARLSSAALLPQIVERCPETIAWAPPAIAFVLERMGLATPVVTMSLPDRGRSRSAVLVAQPGIRNLTELADRRVGWVSRFSTTGHDLPRLYLESFGVDVDALFRSQRFCGSHAAATAALACGEVDVIATHSGALPRVFEATLARLVVSIGPVPSDVLVAGVGVPAGAREHLVQGLRAAPLGNFEFGRASSGHLDLLESLRRHAFDGGTRTLPGRCATVAARP